MAKKTKKMAMGGPPMTTISNVGIGRPGIMRADISNAPLKSKLTPPPPPADFGGKDAGPQQIPPGGLVPPTLMKKGGKIDLNDCKISTHEKSKSSKDW
jgi:hypothetical protein